MPVVSQHASDDGVTGSSHCAAARAARVPEVLAEAQATRCQWEVKTEPTRRLARAADVGLKRRSVLRPDEQLNSAAPRRLQISRARRVCRGMSAGHSAGLLWLLWVAGRAQAEDLQGALLALGSAERLCLAW